MSQSVGSYVQSRGKLRRTSVGDATIGGAPLGSSPRLTEGKAVAEDLLGEHPGGYDSSKLGVYPSRSTGPTGTHSRSKSCGAPSSSRSTRNPDVVSSKSARSENRDASTPGTPNRSIVANGREVSPPRNISSRRGDTSYWDLDHNFPDVHDFALEERKTCIGRKNRAMRCGNKSRCRESASEAIKLIRGVPQIETLEEIAQNLLCKRDHQDQRQAIAEIWLERFTRPPLSPDSTVSYDDDGFSETPGSRSDGTVTAATTPSPLSHRSASFSMEVQASPTAARHARIAAEQSSPPKAQRISNRAQQRSQSEGATSAESPNAPLTEPEPVGSNPTSDSTGQAEFPDEVISLNFREILNFNLNIENGTCICWNRSKPGRCASRISQKRLNNASELLNSLTGLKLPRDAEDYRSGLDELAKLIVCGQHRKWTREMVDGWKSTIEVYTDCPELGPSASQPPTSQVPSSTTTTTPKSTKTTRRGRPDTAAPQPKQRSSYTSSNVDTAFIKMDSQNPDIGGFTEYCPKKKDTKVSVRNYLTKSLSQQDLKDGFIYIYWYPGNFGLLKIGVTKRTVQVRLDEWRRKCGREPKLIYPETPEEAIRTPHIHRVENLVKAELRRLRKKGPVCRKCGIRHEEWFEAEPERAVAVVRRWSEWMEQSPYRKQKGVGSPWLLKDISDAEMSALLNPPVPVIETIPKTRPSRSSRSSTTSSSGVRPALGVPATPSRRSARLARKSAPADAAADAAAATTTPATESGLSAAAGGG
ncbi:hypothetical protein GP486_007968, partial [Trichoglossum hirsutum]